MKMYLRYVYFHIVRFCFCIFLKGSFLVSLGVGAGVGLFQSCYMYIKLCLISYTSDNRTIVY